MTKLRLPTSAPVSQKWGANPAFYAQFGQKGHTGIDFAMAVGQSVKAAAAGTVIFAGHGRHHSGLLDIAGNAAIVDHGDILTTYSHLSRHTVKVGQKVRAGQEIAKSGATGVVTGAHLHWEVWGKPTQWSNGWSGRLDPNKYLSKTKGEEMITALEFQVASRVHMGRAAKASELKEHVGKDTYANIWRRMANWPDAKKARADLKAGRKSPADFMVDEVRSSYRAPAAPTAIKLKPGLYQV